MIGIRLFGPMNLCLNLERMQDRFKYGVEFMKDIQSII